MEWILGLVVVLFIWKKLKGNGAEAIRRAIIVAKNNEYGNYSSLIPWFEIEKFTQQYGSEIHFMILLNNQEIYMTFTKNDDGTAHVSVL